MVDLEPRDEEGRTPQASAGTQGEAASAPACHHCAALVPDDATVCPNCGRKQYRTCFCGTPVRVDLDRCPVCDADWSAKGKIRRRSRSVRVKPRTLLRSALTGALLTVMVSALLNIVITAMAERSTPAGATGLGFGARLYYAWCTVSTAFNTLFTRLLGGLGVVILTAVAGAALGTALYLLRTGYFGSRRHRSTHTPNRRRRSR